MRFDLHNHTVFSDGRNTPEETVLTAIGMGVDLIGFSDHSYTPFDTEYCIPADRVGAYRSEIARLKGVYGGRIRILCGLEQDLDAPLPRETYDYLIGSVHYLPSEGGMIPVDDNPRILLTLAEKEYGGDMIGLAAFYFSRVRQIAEKFRPDIIGHLDLIRKFNADGELFDERDPRYRDAAIDAIDALLPYGIPFEINTGAISRGYQREAYPSPLLMEYLTGKGASFVLSSDSHAKENLCFSFDRFTDVPGLLNEWK